LSTAQAQVRRKRTEPLPGQARGSEAGRSGAPAPGPEEPVAEPGGL